MNVEWKDVKAVLPAKRNRGAVVCYPTRILAEQTGRRNKIKGKEVH